MASPPNKQGMALVSAWVPQTVKERLKSSGGGNLSLGLRAALAAPATTSSGAIWVGHPSELPDPETAEGPAVIATPAGMVVHGIGPASLILDIEANELVFVPSGGPGVARPLDVAALAAFAGRLPAAVLACVSDQSDQFGHDVPAGLHLSRLAPGLIEINPAGSGHRGDGCSVVLSVRHALIFAAEALALLARRVAAEQSRIKALDSLHDRSDELLAQARSGSRWEAQP
jgi:hypothetical protein